MSREHFVWTDDLEIGIDELDEQHKYFYDLANKIIDLESKVGVTKGEVLEAIGKLGGYSMDHFASEEVMLKQLSGPEIDDHLARHDKFRKELKEFIGEIGISGAHPVEIAKQVSEFACSYVENHMLNARTENILKKLREVKK